MRSDMSGWSLWWRFAVASVGMLVTVVVAFGAFPLGLWVGWRVASSGWWWPSTVGSVAVWRVVAGIVAGGLVFRFGLVLRERMLSAWRELRDEGRAAG